MKVPNGYKRCKCRDEEGRELGAQCPKLRRRDGSWNPSHGSWYGKSDFPVPRGQKRAPLRAGGFATQDEMARWFEKAIALLAIPEEGPDGHPVRLEILALIHKTRRDSASLPSAEDIRRRYATGAAFEPGTTGDYLLGWLARHERVNDWSPSTLHEYARIVNARLIPALGTVPLERLNADHIWQMFDRVDERNAEITAARASDDPAVRKLAAGKRPAGTTTKRRNLAVLRSALAEAASSAPGRSRLLSVNVAEAVKFGRDGGRKKTARSRARLWTAARESAWRKGYGERADGLDSPHRYLAWKNAEARPSNVMIWKPDHLGRFLDGAVEDRLYPMLSVIAYCGLRRGEACGLRWEDVDFDSASVMIGPTIIQVGWAAVEKEDAKSGASDDWVRLEEVVMTALREWRQQQVRERLAWGAAWRDTGYVFGHEDGSPYHPAQVSERFARLAYWQSLPPIRLHDLRHGAATLALAAGKSMKEVSAMMRHSSEAITSEIYASVLPELKAEVSAAVASMVPRAAAVGSGRSPFGPQGPDGNQRATRSLGELPVHPRWGARGSNPEPTD